MATEMMSLDSLLGQWGDIPFGAFKASVQYYESMDAVLYLQEDVSYRADRVDQFLTLLWHPYENRAIGVKLKGWRYLFTRLQSIVQATGASLPDDQFLPLISAVEVALTAGEGGKLTAATERRRVADGYAMAREIVDGVHFDVREIRYAA